MPPKNMSSLPEKAPINATNSWVINHARGLIDYDAYAVEQSPIEATEEKGGKTIGGEGQKQGAKCGEFPNPNQRLGNSSNSSSNSSMVEALEAVAAKMADESWITDGEITSSPTSSDTGESFLELKTRRKREEKARATETPASRSALAPAAAAVAVPARPQTPRSGFLAVPPKGQTRHAREGRSLSPRPRHSSSSSRRPRGPKPQLLPLPLCPSRGTPHRSAPPVPDTRRFQLLSISAPLPTTATTTTTTTANSAGPMVLYLDKIALRDGHHAAAAATASEILHPAPQTAGTLTVPSPRLAEFRASPFAAGVEGEGDEGVPVVVLEKTD
ncbi:hypothetical protein SAMD00023353_3600410 [Rosellinia necatrix]|uniref:Uncharacterized protein n=1 Tax=Rosellinia necatrix TaxID=77044 RepID=A0A1W2TN11_ROSNE|nr:hypothetical protein SAMD00023353_3600410 [Rosellinia necatrix]